jgi:hypothetical protein
MDLDKLKETVNSAGVVEELITLSRKVFNNNTDVVKDTIELFSSKAYLMGKKNAQKTFD